MKKLGFTPKSMLVSTKFFNKSSYVLACLFFELHERWVALELKKYKTKEFVGTLVKLLHC